MFHDIGGLIYSVFTFQRLLLGSVEELFRSINAMDLLLVTVQPDSLNFLDCLTNYLRREASQSQMLMINWSLNILHL